MRWEEEKELDMGKSVGELNPDDILISPKYRQGENKVSGLNTVRLRMFNNIKSMAWNIKTSKLHLNRTVLG